MTLEVVQFRCPTCDHPMGEEEYRHACNAFDERVQEKSEERLQKQAEKHRQEMRDLVEKNNLELESRVRQEVEFQQRKIAFEQEEKSKKEKAELAEEYEQKIRRKDEEVKAAKLHSSNYLNERIEQARRDEEERHRQKEKEDELKISRAGRQIEVLEKILDNVPPEFRGTAGEIVLYDELHRAFPQDDLTQKTVGKEMPDVVQTILTESGKRISIPILWDMKTGEKITPQDIAKAKRYKEIYNTDYCFLVTAKGITSKDSKNHGTGLIGNREGVDIIHPKMAVVVAELTRKHAIDKTKLMKNSDRRVSKQMKLYDYITSSARFRKMQEIIQKRQKLDELQRNEKAYLRKLWDKRERITQEWFELDRDDEDRIHAITQEDQFNGQEKEEDMSSKDEEQNEDK